MSVFDKMTEDEIQAAQDRLDELCDENKIERFNAKFTSHKSQKWQALALRMCGLNVPDPTRGRNPDEDLEKAGALAYLYFDLCGYKPENMIDEIIKQYNLKPKKSGHITVSDLRESVRTARKKYKKKIEKMASETKAKETNPDTGLFLETLEEMMEY